MARLPSLRVGLSLDSATFIREQRRVQSEVRDLGRGIQRQNQIAQASFAATTRAVGILRTAIVGLGFGIATGGVAGIAALGSAAIRTADELGKTADRVGVTVETLQQLRFAAEQTGVSQRTLDLGLQRFARRIGEASQGTGELAKIVEQYDIQLRDTQGNLRSVIDILKDYADVVAGAGSSQQELALTFKAVDSEAAGLVNLFRQGSEGIERYVDRLNELGGVLDVEATRKSAEARDALSEMSTAVGTLATKLVTELAPGITTTAQEITALIGLLESGAEAVGNFLSAGDDRDVFRFFAQGQKGTSDFTDSLEELRRRAQETLPAVADEIGELSKAQERLAAFGPSLIKTTAAEARALAGEERAASSKTKAVEELTGAQKRLAEAGQILVQTSAVEERFDHEAEAASRAAAEMRKARAEREKFEAEQRRQAEETQRLLERPFLNFLDSLQASTADAFEEIFSGGVKSFSDLFDEGKRLARRFAAELASLAVFNPQTVLDLAGVGGASGTAATAGGPISLSQAITGVPAGQPVSASGFNFSGRGLALGGAAGFGVGTGVGTAVGGTSTNAAIGAGAGALAGGIAGSFIPVIGTGIGALAGGALGGLLGGLIGGGGSSDKTSGGFSGGIGRAGTFGASEIGSAVRRIDRGILDLLNVRQEALIEKLRLPGFSLSVSGGLSGSDLEAIAARRIGPVAQALGFRRGAVLRGSAEDALQNLQTAVQTQRSIEDLTGAVTVFEREVEALEDTFTELERNARRFGISIDGLAEAQERATEDLRRQQDAQIAALFDPFERLRDPLEQLKASLEFTALNPAEQFRFAREDFRRISGLAQGGDIGAIGDFTAAAQLFVQQAERFGASPAVATARTEILEATADVLQRLEDAQTEASRGVEDVLERLRREQATKLDRLIELTQERIVLAKKGRL